MDNKTIQIVTPSFKIKRNDYKENGKTPIISQEEEYISGYCDLIDERIKTAEYVCFGDHSEYIKYVDFSFVQGADGLKIMIVDNSIMLARYFYHASLNYYVRKNNYERHFKYFSEVQLPVPPLEVQREIVRILDSFTLLTAELTARKKQYEYYRNHLLTYSHDTKQIPLKDLAEFTYGYTDTAKDVGDTRFIRITDITEDGNLKQVDPKYINLSSDSEKYLLHKGDLLLARTGASYGKILYVPNDEQAVYASFLIKITLDNSRILNRYYWYFSKSQLYWNQTEKLVSKGGQQQFNTNAVNRVIVPVPSLEIQKRIVDVLDNFDAICSDLNIGLPDEIEARQKQYEYYRDALLTYAATGEIIVQSDRQTDRRA